MVDAGDGKNIVTINMSIRCPLGVAAGTSASEGHAGKIIRPARQKMPPGLEKPGGWYVIILTMLNQGKKYRPDLTREG